jgi:UDP-N-acetylmuramoyl-L-alanyl-D-glutamate--2,6-diaminopimelate ligase
MTSPTPRGDWRDGLPAEADRAGLPPIRAVRFDSRQVEPGDLFVCVPGERADGHEFAPQAVSAGAVALVAADGRGEALRALGVPVVEAGNPRAALASIAAAHEGYPARSLTVIGVTGTDGKSTTCFLTAAALEGCGLQVGLLTTIESRVAGRVVPNPTRLTSQEAPLIQRLLAEMVEAGCTHAVVEATSIGLDLHRLDGCAFDAAVFTNLSGDHLDYHGTLEAYRKAKGRLFEMLDAPDRGKRGKPVAVLNRDDPAWRYFAGRTKARRVTYAIDHREADVRARDLALWPDGSTFVLVADEDELEASVRLPGRFNVANATAAITVAAALGLDVQRAAAGVAACEGVPGRMQRIPGAPFDVIVDYAHTPDALRKVVETLRPVVPGRLIAVFGCAGERAKDRRTGLGTVAATAVDLSILTDEDPRSEPSEAIIEDIARAMRAAGAVEGEHYERVPDRREAIARALDVAREGDLVLVAGKGHESTIEYASGPVPWDDRQVTAELIAERWPRAEARR